MEYVSFEGLRLDGRRRHECRRMRHEFAVDAAADGSCRLEMGNTAVEAIVHGPRERRGPREEGASTIHSSSGSPAQVSVGTFASSSAPSARASTGLLADFREFVASYVLAIC